MALLPRNSISASRTTEALTEASLTAPQLGTNESSNPITTVGRRQVGTVRGVGRLLRALPRAAETEEGSKVRCRYAAAPASPPLARAGTDSNVRGRGEDATMIACVDVVGEVNIGGVRCARGEGNGDEGANANTSEWVSSPVSSGASSSGRHSAA